MVRDRQAPTCASTVMVQNSFLAHSQTLLSSTTWPGISQTQTCSGCHARVCVGGDPARATLKYMCGSVKYIYGSGMCHPALSHPGKPAPHFLLFNFPITATTTSWIGPELPGTSEEKHMLAMLAKLSLSHIGKAEQVERPPNPTRPHWGGCLPASVTPSKGSHPEHPSEGNPLAQVRSRHPTLAALTHYRACPGTVS